MNEIFTHRTPTGELPTLHVWGWEIPVYLFLGGLVAGLLLLGGYHILRARQRGAPLRAWPYAPMLGIVLLSVGMGALFLDLGHKLYAWRMYLTFRAGSPMSWGAWILVLVYPALLAAAVLYPPERVPFGHSLLALARGWSKRLWAHPRAVLAIGVANMGGGLALGLYTGILLGSLGARPLWNSAILGPLFLLSGLSTAAALMHILSVLSARSAGVPEDLAPRFRDAMLAGLFRLVSGAPATGEVDGAQGDEPDNAATADKADDDAMVRADASFLTFELLVLGLWLIGLATATAVHREAAELLLSGPYAPAFWGLVIVTGLVTPLLLQIGELSGRVRHSLAPAVMVLAGGFALRWILVSAGQISHF